MWTGKFVYLVFIGYSLNVFVSPRLWVALRKKSIGGHQSVKKVAVRLALIALALGFFTSQQAQAQIKLLAVGTLDQSRAGSFADLSGLNYTLENGAPANSLGGFGSAISYASGNTFLALPDRGPNATPYDSNIDDTASYINRFHTITMDLEPNKSGTGLPFTLTPTLRATTCCGA
jgi:hypothetical protein